MGLKDIALWQEQDWITAIAAAVLGFFLLGGAYIATRKEPEFAGHPRGTCARLCSKLDYRLGQLRSHGSRQPMSRRGEDRGHVLYRNPCACA